MARKLKETELPPDVSRETSHDPLLDNATTLNFEEAPPDTYQGEGVMDGVRKIAHALGIAKPDEEKPDKPDKPDALPKGSRLTPAQREFANTVTPPAVMIFIAAMGWLWGRLGKRFKRLAPDNKVANAIIAPLVRIYVRNSKFTAKVTPDAVDLAASLTAIVGYAWTSFQLLDEIAATSEEEEYESERRTYTRQAPGVNGSSGSNGLHQPDYQDLSEDAPGPGLDLRNLSERDRYNYQMLSALRERDFASRARRSGRYGQF